MPGRVICRLCPSTVLLTLPIIICCHGIDYRAIKSDPNFLTGADIRHVGERVEHELEADTRRRVSEAGHESRPRWEPEQWPDGVVPFSIEEERRIGGDVSKQGARNDDVRETDGFFGPFAEAIEDIHMHTCVAFRSKKPTDKFWVAINTVSGRGCWSYVGLQRELALKGQELSLPPECWSKGVILHELMHILGFYHEHTRWDRDEFVELNSANIQKDRLHQFDKRKREVADSAGPYDVESITHYESRAFAVDRRWPTIVARDNRMYGLHKYPHSMRIASRFRKEQSLSNTMGMGQRARLSVWDIEKINRLYNCTARHTSQRHRHKEHYGHRSGHHHMRTSHPLSSKRGRAPRERGATFLNIVTSNLADGHGGEADGDIDGIPPQTGLWSPALQEGSLSMAQRQADLGKSLPTGVMDLFIVPNANEQHVPEPPPPTGYKNRDDFFIRTGLKAAGPSAYAYQLADGSYTMALGDHVPPLQRDQQQPWRDYRGGEIFPQLQSNQASIHPLPVCETSAESNCLDRKEDCVTLALGGECDRRPGVMLQMCRRSCCNCDDSKCYDTRDEPKYGTLCLAQTKQSSSLVLSACDIPETRQNALDYCPKTCGTCIVSQSSTPPNDRYVWRLY